MENQIKRVSVLGVPLDIITNNFEEYIEDLIGNQGFDQLRFLSYKDFIKSIFSREKKAKLKSCSLIIPTSSRVTFALNTVHRVKMKVFKEFDFVISILGLIEKTQGSIYIVGENIKNLPKVESNLKSSFPGLRLVGRYWGRFNKDSELNLVQAIRKASPTILLAGKGVKSKDNWLYKNKENIGCGLGLYTGKCFQVFSGYRGKYQSYKKLNPFDFIHGILTLWFYPSVIINKLAHKN